MRPAAGAFAAAAGLFPDFFAAMACSGVEEGRRNEAAGVVYVPALAMATGIGRRRRWDDGGEARTYFVAWARVRCRARQHA